MLDFYKIRTRTKTLYGPKREVLEVYPSFIVTSKSTDLMIRGGDFYAVWVEDTKMWSTDEDEVIRQVDEEVAKSVDEKRQSHPEMEVVGLYMSDSDSGAIDRWHKYCQKQMRDRYKALDEKIIFSNTKTKKRDYISKKLDYAIEAADTPAYDELISALYEPDERKKLEWAIGAIISGDAKKIQKFIVLYGSAGSGKSTVLNIIEWMFDGYYTYFNAKELTGGSNSFALESFKTNPLIAIQHDGDLSRIEDNTKLNSLVSHEKMEINEKNKPHYVAKFNAFVFMGTNKPVRITEAKSGLIRRLIDVTPSGRKLPYKKYNDLRKKIKFELGGIAQHCLDVYSEMGEDYYENYVPLMMMAATNDFYGFVDYNYDDFKKLDEITLSEAWKRYRLYCDYASVNFPFNMRQVRVELKNYFKEYKEQGRVDGKHVRNLYSGFIAEKITGRKEIDDSDKSIDATDINDPVSGDSLYWLVFSKDIPSILDETYSDYPAQLEVTYGDSGRSQPGVAWAKCKTKLKDIDTSQTHYLKGPENLIFIDFDLKNKEGEKDFDLNLKEALKWPPTYAELSKSGKGIHLYYIYEGDVTKLSRIYDDNIEVKVPVGGSSIRRRLTMCNDIPIATINSGLPLKGEAKKMDNWGGLKSEKQIRTMIKRNLQKEYHDATKPSIDYIYAILEEAYSAGIHYDVTDLRTQVLAFANNSTHQAKYCVNLVSKMHFSSDDFSVNDYEYDDKKLAFFDIEVFPNLLLVNWKYEGSPSCIRMINPSPGDVEEFFKLKLVGFNNRRYDNHVLYARSMGYTIPQCYKQSKKLISGLSSDGATFGEAYNKSYTDVYDFCSTKQSLKKWEIELRKKGVMPDLKHKELALNWDEPVPEELWNEVAEYCDNDVIATEATFNANIADFEAREILVALANIFATKTKSTVNDTTNTLTGRIIFGDNRKPQSEFVYTDLSKYFPGYVYENGKSTYQGEEVGEGGYVYAEPGMYTDVVTFDVASMHPHSVIALNLFGDRYTEQFKMLVDLRIMIKHKEFDKAKALFDGALTPYLENESQAKALSNALKIAINSVYGLTAANFDNVFRDTRNKDNIVAKRGALFMIDLKRAVQKMGGKVIHCKTDSIKVVNPSKELSDYIFEYGKKWGYTFEIEAEYEKICLVNDAVYIAKERKEGWTATGKQFAEPYVFKTLFSKEPVEFSDLCQTKSVSTSLYLDMNETLPEDVHNYKFVGKVGLFCPMKPGTGGGILLREKDGKYNAATGTKGYRWMESEMVETLDKKRDIDMSYFVDLADRAVSDISKFGDFEWFVSSETDLPTPDFMNIPDTEEEEIPWDPD